MILIISVVSLMLLSGCNNSADYYINWTEAKDEQIQCLDDANIKYEIREEVIWVRERDLHKIDANCSLD